MNKIANFFIASEENGYRPRVLSYWAFIIYGLILLALRLFLGILPADSSAVESQTLMALVNEERNNRNIPQLITHSSLMVAAAQKSRDMIDRDFFNHVNPDGNYIWGNIINAGYYPYKILGENLALDFATAEGMIKAWLDSPTHRENLLRLEFINQGMSALYGDYQGRYTNLTTNLFGALVSEQSSPPATQTTEPQPIPTPQVKAETPAVAQKNPTPEPRPKEEEKTIPEETTNPVASPASEPIPTPPSPKHLLPVFEWSRTIFTSFGIFMLLILSIDSVIVNRRELEVPRSHSSYHFFGFTLIVLVSILIWWW
ncbi:MAG: CAP domain-containing protein [Candidatus Doudnabacteria bacterium]|nr:CAP domain-containing protein [Candidatus Doudnabacteria bacterium]